MSRLQLPRKLCHQVQVAARRPFSTTLATSSGAAAEKLLRRPSSTALVQESSAVLVRLAGAAPKQQVEALEQLASLAAAASAEDLQALTERKEFRAPLAELLRHLPRDAGEKVLWEPAWTLRVIEALRDLRAQGIEPQLSQRLGYALLQAAPEMGLAELLQRTRDLCAGGARVDDYVLWVLALELEELCGAELGKLEAESLASLLHLLAHPSLQVARSSPQVLRHVRHILPSCKHADLAKLLQAYSDVPSIVTDVLRILNTKSASLQMTLPELTVVASLESSLSAKEEGQLSAAILSRLQELTEDPCDLELAITCALGALPGLSAATAADQEQGFAALRRALSNVSGRADGKPEFLAQLVLIALQAGEKLDWTEALASQLAPKTGELSATMLAELIVALASTEQDLPEALAESLAVSALAHAPAWPSQQFASVAKALAELGMLQHELLEAGDVEARICSSQLDERSVISLVWAAAACGMESDSWPIVATRLDASAVLALPTSEQGLLLEALSARRSQSMELFKSLRSSWIQKAASSENEALVAGLLKDLNIKFQRGVEAEDSLYKIPLLLPDQKIIIDLLHNARHPASQRARGDVQLRHQVWSASGYSVLAIPDSVWPRIEAGEAGKQEWLQKRLDNLAREDLIQRAQLSPEIVGELRHLNIGDDGLNFDALRRLAQAPLSAQKRSVKKFSATSKTANVKNPSAWMIGIIKQEEAASEKEQEMAKKPEALKKRPKEGWENQQGRALEDVKVNERLSGRVKNVMNDRVWVDAGLRKDVTFLARGVPWKVGDEIKNLTVTLVDLEKRWVEVKPRILPARRKPKASQESKKTEEASTSSPGQRRKDATSPKPAGGWEHTEGITVASLKVGSVVSGKVTNMFRERVWVNIGAEKDACFINKSMDEKYNVGDFISEATIQSIDLDKAHVVISAPKPAK